MKVKILYKWKISDGLLLLVHINDTPVIYNIDLVTLVDMKIYIL